MFDHAFLSYMVCASPLCLGMSISCMTWVAVVTRLISLNMTAFAIQQHAFPADELRPVACSGRFRGIGCVPNVP
jgi:hypothetical protein